MIAIEMLEYFKEKKNLDPNNFVNSFGFIMKY